MVPRIRARNKPRPERLAGEAVGLEIDFVFPAAYVGIALVGTVILALLVMLAPLHRAVRFKPGEAIRYA